MRRLNNWGYHKINSSINNTFMEKGAKCTQGWTFINNGWFDIQNRVIKKFACIIIVINIPFNKTDTLFVLDMNNK